MSIQQVAAVIRWTQAAGWYIQNDAGHSPIGVSSISVVERAYGTRLNIVFNFTAAKVGSIILQPDNQLLRDGYCGGGAECGLTSVDFELFRDIDVRGQVSWDGSQYVLNYVPAAFPATVENLGSGLVRVHHTTLSDALVIPQLTARNQFSAGAKIGQFGTDFFEIQFDPAAPPSQHAALFKRATKSSVSPYAGYANPDGNYWLLGTMIG